MQKYLLVHTYFLTSSPQSCEWCSYRLEDIVTAPHNSFHVGLFSGVLQLFAAWKNNKKNQVDSFSNFALFSAFVIGKISKAFMNFELSLTFVIKPTNYWKMIRGFEIGSWIPWSNILVKNSEGKKILQRKGNYVRIPKSLSSYSFHFFSKLTRLANPIFIVNHYDL